jgi:exonuclease III
MLTDLIPPIKRYHLTNQIKKEDLTICCLQETQLINKNKHSLKVKGWKTIYQVNVPRKQAGVPILISDKADFKPTLIKQDKEGHSILIKGNNNYQPIYTQHQCTLFHQVCNEGPKNIYKLHHNGSGRL